MREHSLVILGTGGNCVDILDTTLDIAKSDARDTYKVVGFLDDDSSRHGTHIHGVPVLGGLDRAVSLRDVWFINGIGSPHNYRRKPEILASAGIPDARFATIVHPSAVVSNFASLGAGTVLLQNVVVASGARVGAHVMVLPLSIVSHDVIIEDYAILAGGVALSGGVVVEKAAYVGSNAAVRGNLRIGSRALVGMGAVVISDVAPESVVAGVPASPMKRKSK